MTAQYWCSDLREMKHELPKEPLFWFKATCLESRFVQSPFISRRGIGFARHHYGKGKENLGNEPVYTRFLEGTRPVFEECFRVLMPGRKLCLVTAHSQYAI